MAGGQLWQNSKGEIIQCEDGNIAFAETCPCIQWVYIPAVLFTCNPEIAACDYYYPYDKVLLIKTQNGKLKQVWSQDESTGKYTDLTTSIKKGNTKLLSYVNPVGDVENPGPLGEQSSLVYANVKFPEAPKGDAVLSFLTYEDTRLACFYELEKTAWIVPSSWYGYSFYTDFTVKYDTTCVTGNWKGSSYRADTCTITPIVGDSGKLTFEKTNYAVIKETLEVLCKDPSSDLHQTKPVQSSVEFLAGKLPSGASLTEAASYKCCNKYNSSISMSEIEKATASIVVQFTLTPDNRLPDKSGCSCYSPGLKDFVDNPKLEKACEYISPTVVKDVPIALSFITEYSYGKILFTTSNPTQSFTGVKATESGTDECYITGDYTCTAEGSGTVSITLNNKVTIKSSDEKVSCTYTEYKKELSLYPIKIEE